MAVRMAFVVMVALGLVGEYGGQARPLCENGEQAVVSHRGTDAHCLCTPERPICEGPQCSTGHQHCGSGSTNCQTVFGYLATCTECTCDVASAHHTHEQVPEQVFGAVTGRAGELAISFGISGPTTLVQVRFGFHAEDLNNLAVASERVDHDYDTLHMTFYAAMLTATPNTDVYYRVFNGRAATAVYHIRMPIDTLSSARIALVGDLGLSYSAPMVMQALRYEANLSMWLHPGDVSYAFDLNGLSTYFNRAQPIVAQLLYQTCLGNHESENHVVREAYKMRLPNDLAARASGSSSEHWYSYDTFGIHVAIVDSMAPHGPGTDQYKWLVQDLAAAQARRTANPEAHPWIMVMWHFPMYVSHLRGHDHKHDMKPAQMQELRDSLEQVLLDHQVDFLLTGHDHVYERMYPLAHGQRDDNHGMVHLVVGSGGHNIYADWAKMPAYSASRLARPGYGVFDLKADGTLHWNFYEVQIAPCTLAYDGGDARCPLNLLTESHDVYRPQVRLHDSTTYTPRHRR